MKYARRLIEEALEDLKAGELARVEIGIRGALRILELEEQQQTKKGASTPITTPP